MSRDSGDRRVRLLVILILFAGLSALHGQSAPLRLTRTISLPAVEGRIDHFGFDPSGQRLFVCALGNNTVEVIDLLKGERIHSITGLAAPQGVAYAPEVDRLFVANDKGGILKMYGGDSFDLLGEINLQDDADNVRYDASARKIYVGFGTGGLAIINASDGRQIGSIKLAAHPEAFALERGGGRIFVNVPNARHVAVIDRKQRKVIATWKTDLAFANFPMALDQTNHRLFVGCRMPSRLVVINTDSGEVMSRSDLCGDADDLFYDQKRHRIYATCGAGKIDVIEQTDPNSYKTTVEVETAAGARTGWFAPELETLYVAIPHRGAQQAEIRAYHVE